MKITSKKEFNNSGFLLETLNLTKEINECLTIDGGLPNGGIVELNEIYENNFSLRAWGLNSLVSNKLNIKITARKEKVGVQIQTGNIARAYYDLLKLEAMFNLGHIVVGCLVLPDKKLANKINNNVAQFERIVNEYETLDLSLRMPLCIIGIGE